MITIVITFVQTSSERTICMAWCKYCISLDNMQYEQMQ